MQKNQCEKGTGCAAWPRSKGEGTLSWTEYHAISDFIFVLN